MAFGGRWKINQLGIEGSIRGQIERTIVRENDEIDELERPEGGTERKTAVIKRLSLFSGFVCVWEEREKERGKARDKEGEGGREGERRESEREIVRRGRRQGRRERERARDS